MGLLCIELITGQINCADSTLQPSMYPFKSSSTILRAEVSHKLVARLSRCTIFEGVNFIKVYYIFPKLFNHCKAFSRIALQVDKSTIYCKIAIRNQLIYKHTLSKRMLCCTANVYRALQGLCRFSLLWGKPVIFTDCGEILLIIMGFPCNL